MTLECDSHRGPSCEAVAGLDRDLRALQGCVNDKLDAVIKLGNELVELRGEHNRHGDALTHIGKEVRWLRQRVDDVEDDVSNLKTSDAVLSVRVRGNERVLWQVWSIAGPVIGAALTWYLTARGG